MFFVCKVILKHERLFYDTRFAAESTNFSLLKFSFILLIGFPIGQYDSVRTTINIRSIKLNV